MVKNNEEPKVFGEIFKIANISGNNDYELESIIRCEKIDKVNGKFRPFCSAGLRLKSDKLTESIVIAQ